MKNVNLEFSGTIAEMLKFLNETLTAGAQAKSLVTLNVSLNDVSGSNPDVELILIAQNHFNDYRNKIQTIKHIREISRKTLTEAKEFFEKHVESPEQTANRLGH